MSRKRPGRAAGCGGRPGGSDGDEGMQECMEATFCLPQPHVPTFRDTVARSPRGLCSGAWV